MDFEKSKEYYVKIVNELRNRVKKLIVISLLPTDRKYINIKVEDFNNWLKNSYPNEFLNLYQYFIDENLEMKRVYTTDESS